MPASRATTRLNWWIKNAGAANRMTQIDLTGKTALITGASRGIGAAVAKAYAKAGAHVILIARTQGGLEEVDDAIKAEGGQATLLRMDLFRGLEKIEKLGPTILERFGGLDIFVGNAGILGTLSPAHQIKTKDWEKVMLTNFMANVWLTRSLDPLLRASEAGRVIFTSTNHPEKLGAYWGPYASSKAALNTFAKTYAAEVKETNIKATILDPGIVDTKLLGEAFPGGFPGKVVQPEEVAPLFLDLAV